MYYILYCVLNVQILNLDAYFTKFLRMDFKIWMYKIQKKKLAPGLLTLYRSINTKL